MSQQIRPGGRPRCRACSPAAAGPIYRTGRAALPALGKAFAHLGRAVEDMRGGSQAGTLVSVGPPSFAHRWLVPRLSGLHHRPARHRAHRPGGDPHPRLRPRGRSTSASATGEAIYPGLPCPPAAHRVVFPVCAPSLVDGRRPLRRPGGFAPPHPDPRAVASAEPLLEWVTWLREAGIDGPRGQPRAGLLPTSTMLVEAAVRGIGVALGRSILVADELLAGRLVRPLAATRPADFCS